MSLMGPPDMIFLVLYIFEMEVTGPPTMTTFGTGGKPSEHNAFDTSDGSSDGSYFMIRRLLH